MVTLGEWVRAASQRLAEVSATPRLDAELLCCHSLGMPRSACFSQPERPLTTHEQRAMEQLLRRRAAGEPVAYLLGRRGFWTLDLAVDRRVLIPRPETELVVERCLAWIPADAAWELADLGTGSGAIALALASERPACQVTAVDRSAEALRVARANGRRLRCRVRWRHGDWFDPLEGRRFHLIASNPPYIAEGDRHLDHPELAQEPRQALVAGPDGLAALRRIIAGAPRHLRPGGHLVLEHGYDQGHAVAALLAAAGFSAIECHRDLSGQPRVTEARLEMPPPPPSTE